MKPYCGDRRFALLLFIATHNVQYGRPPSIQQMQAVRGYDSTIAVQQELAHLRKGGHLALVGRWPGER